MADYSQMLQLVADYYGAGSDQWLKVAGGQGASADELLTILKQTPGVNVITNEAGEYRGWVLSNTGSSNIGTSIGSAANSNIIGGTNAIDSIGTTYMPPEMTTDSTGLITVKNAAKTAGGKWVTSGGVAPAIAVAATGISLGITIDKALYAAKPGFLSDEQLETLNPDNWKNISNVVDEQWTAMGYPTVGKIGRKVFDTVLGIDSTDNSTQMYIDEDAYAYAAWYLQQQGGFTVLNYANQGSLPDSSLNYPGAFEKLYYSTDKLAFYESYGHVEGVAFLKEINFSTLLGGSDVKGAIYAHRTGLNPFCSVEFFSRTELTSKPKFTSTSTYSGKVETYYASGPYTYYLSDNTPIYTYSIYGGTYESSSKYPDYPTVNIPSGYSETNVDKLATDVIRLLYEGESISGSSVDGIASQSGATLPNLSTATDLDSFKTLLKQQYPDVWTNSVTKSVLQPDGTLKTFTYVPVPTPNATYWMDTEPTGNGSQQSQKDTVVQPGMDTSIKDTISSSGSTGTTTPNPPDTGGGDSPTVVPPVGKASSLWSIYNPTLEQVNQFGSWLWSSDFVEQLKKLFSDPMQAIIGLHKVYSPVQTSGEGTIKCGYLDSEVSSKLVSEQYVTVDCGSVDLQEYFGNVFDYPPYTEVSIYLPFIGVRQLDTSDVMRSTISVKYHVDVLTGACLAEVNVQRDAAGGTLYTFSGDAAVRYPVSSGSYMGIVSGLIGVATSVVSGNLLPALGGATRLHTNVDRSGSFTGNAGAMGSKVPYLIISRPQTAMADNFETLSGYPSNTYTPLSACTGYTQVRYVHVENLTATDAEKQEIERLLKEGVIL